MPAAHLSFQAEGQHLGGLVDPAGLHGLAADVENGPRLREEERGATRAGGEVGHVQILEVDLVAADASGHHVVDVPLRHPGRRQGALVRLPRQFSQPEPGRSRRPAEDRTLIGEHHDLGVGRADIDTGGNGHDGTPVPSLAGARPAAT